MNTTTMKKMMVSLAEVELTESPVLSCMVDLTQTHYLAAEEVDMQVAKLARSLDESTINCVNEAVNNIKDYILNTSLPNAKGLAIYARVGEDPFLYAMPLGVKVATDIVVDELPHVYPLVETMDVYHRFVIVTLTEKEAHIYETTAGAITSQILTEKPDLREKIGREWTRERYHNHKEDRKQKFLQGKIEVLDDLVNKSEHTHIIVSGSPKVVSSFVDALPMHLRNKMLDALNINPKSGIDPILISAIQSFVENEAQESRDKVRQLESEVMRKGLGVTGKAATEHALVHGYAETLIIDQNYPEYEREELVKKALQAKLEVETVKESAKLDKMGGVGCLLRYRPSHIQHLVKMVSS